MKTIKVLPLKVRLSLKSYSIYYSPFLTGMAKGLRLVREAIKLGCGQVDLVLNGGQPIGVLSLDFSQAVNPFKNDLKSIRRHC